MSTTETVTKETSELSALMVGKRWLVFTPTTTPYRGKLLKVLDEEMLFEGKDGKLKFIPRRLYDMEEERNA